MSNQNSPNPPLPANLNGPTSALVGLNIGDLTCFLFSSLHDMNISVCDIGSCLWQRGENGMFQKNFLIDFFLHSLHFFGG